MPFAKFKGFGLGGEKFVNVGRIVSFEQYSSNGNNGTELKMDDGSNIRVGHWPVDVAKIIDAVQVRPE